MWEYKKFNFRKVRSLPILLLLVLGSCMPELVSVKHPVPKMRPNKHKFGSDLAGEYLISDTILDDGLYRTLNELYSPKIVLDSDSAFVVSAQMQVSISRDLVVLKKNYSAHMLRSFYDSLDLKKNDRIESIIFSGDSVKLISKEMVDTLFNIKGGDILRKYGDQYLLNKRYEDSYQPMLLTKNKSNLWSIHEIKRDSLVDYYRNSDNRKMNSKAELLNNGDPINLKNTELKHLIDRNLFTVRYTLLKKGN